MTMAQQVLVAEDGRSAPGLVDQSQKMTVAAMQMADTKLRAQRPSG
jgi:hypothetical protein